MTWMRLGFAAILAGGIFPEAAMTAIAVIGVAFMATLWVSALAGLGDGVELGAWGALAAMVGFVAVAMSAAVMDAMLVVETARVGTVAVITAAALASIIRIGVDRRATDTTDNDG